MRRILPALQKKNSKNTSIFINFRQAPQKNIVWMQFRLDINQP